VLIHGDIAVGNVLIQDDRLSAVIGFSRLAIGVPAWDLLKAGQFVKFFVNFDSLFLFI